MALLIDNDVVGRVVTTEDAVDAIDEGLRQLASGDATFQRRVDVSSPTAEDGDYYRFGVQFGAIRHPPRLALRFKSSVLRWEQRGDGVVREKFNTEPGTYLGFILLFDTATGELIALLNDGILQHLRTGATAGLASRQFAREDARTLGMLGSGHMAHDYARALAYVHDLDELTVFSPTTANREAFADKMSEELGIDVQAVESAREAVRDTDIVATCTNASQPVFKHDWIEPGQFIVNVNPAEMSDQCFETVDRVAMTTTEPITENIFGTPEERARWPGRDEDRQNRQKMEYPTLIDVLAGDEPGRQSEEETILYNNTAIGGVQFATIGTLAYEEAVDRKLGTRVPIEWFWQNIKN